MPSQRLIWTGLTTASTSPSIPIDDQSLLIREYNWHVFASGTFGSGGQVQVQYSPDLLSTSDANSIWYAPTALLLTQAGDTFFQAKPRKFRIVINSGDGTTLINVEIR